MFGLMVNNDKNNGSIQFNDLVEVIEGDHEDRHNTGLQGRLIERLGAGKSKARLQVFNRRGEKSGYMLIEFKNLKLVEKYVPQIEEENFEEEEN